MLSCLMVSMSNVSRCPTPYLGLFEPSGGLIDVCTIVMKAESTTKSLEPNTIDDEGKVNDEGRVDDEVPRARTLSTTKPESMMKAEATTKPLEPNTSVTKAESTMKAESMMK